MKPLSFVLDFPTNLSFYIASSIIFIFIVFIGIIVYMAVQEHEITFMKGAFVALTFISIIPFMLSIDLVFSKNAQNVSSEELNAYAEQFNLLSNTENEKYYVISGKTDYYDFKSLVFILNKNEDESEIVDEVKELRKICFERKDIDIHCSLEYDSKIYPLLLKNKFDRVFRVYEDSLTIKYYRLEKMRDYDLNLFDYQKEIVYSSNNELNLFLTKLMENDIKVISLGNNKIDLIAIENDKPKEEIEVKLDDSLTLTIKEYFPMEFKKYQFLLNEINTLTSKTDIDLNILFNNKLLKSKEIKNELLKKEGGN